MIIPTYLKNIANSNDLNRNTGTFKIKCPCGCEQFFIYKNIKKRQKISREDRRKIKETELWEDKVLSPLITNYGDSGKKQSAAYFNYPEEKYREIVIYDSTDLSTKFDLKKDKERIVKVFKVNYGEVPLSIHEINAIEKYDKTSIIKIKCLSCNSEYVLFDSRIHGCDSADFVNNELEEYDYKEIKIKDEVGKSYKVNIYIENYWDLDDNFKLINNDPNIDYSNMFNYIKIQIINELNEKKNIFSDELG